MDYTRAVKFMKNSNMNEFQKNEFFEVIKDIQDQVLKECHEKTMKLFQRYNIGDAKVEQNNLSKI